MNITSEVDFINKAITNQRLALRFHSFLAIGVIILGIIAIVFVQILSGVVVPENLKWILTLGGTFISTLSSFPFKEIFLRKDKVAALELLLDEFRRLQVQQKPDKDEYELIQNRFWNLVDKNLGG